LISKLEKEITLRYLKTRKKDGFLNIITIFSFIGISLGVAVLIIVMSVMNGFRADLIKKINGFNAHAVIQSYGTFIDEKKLNKKSINKNISFKIFSNNGEGVIIKNKRSKGILLRGYLKNDFKKLEIIKKDNFVGEKSLKKNNISISQSMAADLNLKLNDNLTIIFPSSLNTLVGALPNQKKFIISSLFESGFSDFDQNIVFINLKDLENILNLNNNERVLEIYFDDPSNIEILKKKIQDIYKDKFVFTWSDLNKPLFAALKVERNVMFIILSLIIIVAAFNIISGLTILVKNKTRDIAILKSIGVESHSILKIFFMIGFVIGLTATSFGVFLGVIFSVYIENIRQIISNLFDISLFPEEIYFLSEMPYQIDINSILLISVCSIISTCLVSIFPAIKASKLDTIKSLKYE
tara:strand:+ start:4213 stop:5442 length:1230 start_codon:yes stop_codon:yes gene_type:complete